MDTREIFPLYGLNHWNEDVVPYPIFPKLITEQGTMNRLMFAISKALLDYNWSFIRFSLLTTYGPMRDGIILHISTTI